VKTRDGSHCDEAVDPLSVVVRLRGHGCKHHSVPLLVTYEGHFLETSFFKDEVYGCRHVIVCHLLEGIFPELFVGFVHIPILLGINVPARVRQPHIEPMISKLKRK
jgi:hypothetical protein